MVGRPSPTRVHRVLDDDNDPPGQWTMGRAWGRRPSETERTPMTTGADKWREQAGRWAAEAAKELVSEALTAALERLSPERAASIFKEALGDHLDSENWDDETIRGINDVAAEAIGVVFYPLLQLMFAQAVNDRKIKATFAKHPEGAGAQEEDLEFYIDGPGMMSSLGDVHVYFEPTD